MTQYLLDAVLYVLLVLGGVALGFWIHYTERAPRMLVATGWIYFISAKGGSHDEPPAPIKVGFTHRNPMERLPEIERMSPDRLELIWCFKADYPEQAERAIHKELDYAHDHGEWYERDATLAFISFLRGETLARGGRR